MSQSGRRGTTAQTPGQRLYLIRLALGDGVKNAMKISDFVELVRRVTGARYDGAAISRSENGSRKLTLDDVTAFAAVDPERRSRAWLAFGNDEPIARIDIPDEMSETFSRARRGEAPPTAAEEAPPQRAAGGRRGSKRPKDQR